MSNDKEIIIPNSGEAGIGTIDNPRGGKVLKVAYFDELKTICGKYNHNKSFTDFELNEFLSKKYANDKYFNLETYLKKRSETWKKFKIRFPNANRNDFKLDNDYNIYYKDTPIEVFGDRVSEKFNDRVKKALGISTSFPFSLLSTVEKYPIPGTDYNNQPSSILNKFEIAVSNNQSYRAKFRNIFKSTIITFNSASQCRRWLGSPNMNYWPQQLNFAVWCATSGCGICLNEGYPKRIQEFINFHIYFTIRRILWELNTPLPDDTIFNRTSNHYDKIEYQRLCQEFNIDTESDFRFLGGKNHGLGTIFINGRIPPIASGLVDWPNSTPIFHDEPGIGGLNGKIINLANGGKPYEWFGPEKGKGLTRTGLGRLNRSVEAFVSCVVGAEVNVRSSIVGRGGGGQETQQEMLKLFEEAVIEEDISKSVQRYQLAVQFFRFNNFLLKAKKDMTFGENKLLNNKIKKVGIDHNLGTSKKNQPIVKTDDDPVASIIHHTDINDSAEDDNDDDRDDKVGINKKPSIESSHELKKTTAIIIAAAVGYMMFR